MKNPIREVAKAFPYLKLFLDHGVGRPRRHGT
jgi:hypothetical protein